MKRKAFTGDPACDLSNELTVCVSTVGEPTTERCLQHLAQQDCRFQIKIIRNETPLSSALQAMIDRVETPYYVQVDADMILKPHAVSWLYARMTMLRERTPKLAMLVMPLYDVHMGIVMTGVKIYLHRAMDQSPYRDVQSCEVDQLKRLEGLGWQYRVEFTGAERQDDDEVLGYHGTSYTNYGAFERYKDLMEKQRKLGSSPFVERLLQTFLESYRTSENRELAECNLWAAIGIIAGAATDLTAEQGEKDASKYAENDELYAHLRQMLTGGQQ